MAVTEDDIIRDEQERSNLLRAIADVETAIAVSTPGARRVLENTRDNAMKRIVELDKKIEEAKVEHQAAEQAQMAAAALAEKETRLNAEERETYRGFLGESYFKKNDFGKLDEFYSHTYNRLSEGGKDEMSHRVWEGIRHHEYEFTDLPNEVQDKEAKRLYSKLVDPSRARDSLGQVPEKDRDDFVHAFEAKDSTTAAKILTRDSFRKNVALETASAPKHQAASLARDADDSSLLAGDKAIAPDETPIPSTPPVGGKFDSINLKDITLTESRLPPSAASMPDASGSRVNVRSPV